MAIDDDGDEEEEEEEEEGRGGSRKGEGRARDEVGWLAATYMFHLYYSLSGTRIAYE